MMRDGLSDNAAHASCLLSPTNGVYFRHRDSAGATSTTTQTANTVVPPEWVRLVRAGDTFTSYHSEDGSAWTLIGTQTIAMPDTLNVGLAVTATNDAALCTEFHERRAHAAGLHFSRDEKHRAGRRFIHVVVTY